MAAKIRLYVDQPLGPGQSVALTQPQAHYLFAVMRLSEGATVTLFNGREGAFAATVTRADKRKGTLAVGEQTAPLQPPPDLWLMFAPIKKARTDFIVEKAVEMGAARIVPVHTDFTNAERIRHDRLQAHAIEAAEQCGATMVPEVTQIARLGALLDDWPGDRRLMFCDEALAGTAAPLPDTVGAADPWAILIGPEGGFSDSERVRLSQMAGSHPVSLGPRILRADTAAVAALTLWQLRIGDWR